MKFRQIKATNPYSSTRHPPRHEEIQKSSTTTTKRYDSAKQDSTAEAKRAAYQQKEARVNGDDGDRLHILVEPSR
jgi:hypothetical protein